MKTPEEIALREQILDILDDYYQRHVGYISTANALYNLITNNKSKIKAKVSIIGAERPGKRRRVCGAVKSIM